MGLGGSVVLNGGEHHAADKGLIRERGMRTIVFRRDANGQVNEFNVDTVEAREIGCLPTC
jgi:hypothetical protein